MLIRLSVQLLAVVVTTLSSLWENREATGLAIYNHTKTLAHFAGALTLESRVWGEHAAERLIVAFNALEIGEYSSNILKLAVGEKGAMGAIGGGEGDEFPEWEFDYDFEKGEYTYDATLDFASPFFLHVQPAPIDDEEIFARRASKYDDGESSEKGSQLMTGGVGCALIGTLLIYNAVRIGFPWICAVTRRFLLRQRPDDHALRELQRMGQELRDENAELRRVISDHHSHGQVVSLLNNTLAGREPGQSSSHLNELFDSDNVITEDVYPEAMLCKAEESELEGQKDEAEAGEPCDEAGEPCDEVGEPCSEADESCSEADESCSEADESCSEADEPCNEADEPCNEADEPCDEADEPCDEPCEPCDEAGEPCEDAGVPPVTDSEGTYLCFQINFAGWADPSPDNEEGRKATWLVAPFYHVSNPAVVHRTEELPFLKERVITNSTLRLIMSMFLPPEVDQSLLASMRMGHKHLKTMFFSVGAATRGPDGNKYYQVYLDLGYHAPDDEPELAQLWQQFFKGFEAIWVSSEFMELVHEQLASPFEIQDDTPSTRFSDCDIFP